MEFKFLKEKRKIFYQVTFLIGLILISWEISIFRRTFIPLDLLLSIVVATGGVATFLDFKHYRKTYDINGWKLYFFAFMQNTVSWGFIACSILVLSNYYLSEGQTTDEKYEIIETSYMPGSKGSRSKFKPLVRIDYKGKTKELVFSNKFHGELEEYDHVSVSVKKGFLNWDVIMDQKLEK